VPCARAETEDTVALVTRLTGKVPVPSSRVSLTMPATFPNGYTVPLALAVASPMTDAEHVKAVRVLAPQNPLIEVATFRFAPGRSQPRVATRIRLAKPQDVVALAEMSDGTLLMAKTWVDVASNGCK
jgi:sulfur-oxidizing protein SoxY